MRYHPRTPQQRKADRFMYLFLACFVTGLLVLITVLAAIHHPGK